MAWASIDYFQNVLNGGRYWYTNTHVAARTSRFLLEMNVLFCFNRWVTVFYEFIRINVWFLPMKSWWSVCCWSKSQSVVSILQFVSIFNFAIPFIQWNLTRSKSKYTVTSIFWMKSWILKILIQSRLKNYCLRGWILQSDWIWNFRWNPSSLDDMLYYRMTTCSSAF